MGEGPDRWRRAAPWVALGLFAFAVRITFVLLVTRTRDLGFDAAWYDLVARQLRAGNGFLEPFALDRGDPAEGTALFLPGYPVVLAILSPFSGGHLAHLFASCVIGSGTVVATAMLGRRVAGMATGLIAGVVASIHPMVFGADTSLMPESLYMLLVVVTLLLTYRILDAAPGSTSPVWLLVTGAVIGLAMLTRGEGALLLAIPVVALTRTRARRPAIALAALVIAPAVLMQVPWAVRNYRLFDQPVIGANSSSTL